MAPSLATVQWGAVSDWVSGVATATAVIVALVFSLRLERQQRAAELAAVHAWFELRPAADGQRGGVLWLVNDTSYPIYDWSVAVSWRAQGSEPVEIEIGRGDHGLIPPGRRAEFTLRDSPDTPLPANDADVAVELRFRDATGRERCRMPGGKLKRAGRR